MRPSSSSAQPWLALVISVSPGFRPRSLLFLLLTHAVARTRISSLFPHSLTFLPYSQITEPTSEHLCQGKANGSLFRPPCSLQPLRGDASPVYHSSLLCSALPSSAPPPNFVFPSDILSDHSASTTFLSPCNGMFSLAQAYGLEAP